LMLTGSDDFASAQKALRAEPTRAVVTGVDPSG